MRRTSAIILAAALVLTACGDLDDDASATSTDTASELAPDAAETLSEDTSSEVEEALEEPATGMGDLDAVIADIESFWEREDESIGFTYEPLADDRIVAMTTTDVELPVCYDELPDPAEAEENAYAADCPEGLTVVYDVPGLFEPLGDQFGPAGPAVTLAHEWGHVVEYQSGITFEGVIGEQFADCMAGAWVVDAFDREVAPFDDEGRSLDQAVIAILDFRDAPGDSAEAEDAHGSGFDRVAAFQEGFEQGVEACATYQEDPPALFQFPFESAEDEATGGNLPLDEILALTVPELNRVFAARYDGFPELAADDVFDVELLPDVSDELGDFAVSTLLATLWAAQAQELTGAVDPLQEGEAFIDQACQAGGWIDAVLTSEEGELGLSPGDLDEAIGALAAIVSSREEQASAGLLFAGVQAMRTGFAEGFDACTA